MSFATAPMDDFDISELPHQARTANERHRVTGVLLYFDDVFLQVLEGEKSDVLRLFENIESDDRNYGHTVILEKGTASRQFGDWSMRCEVVGVENVRRVTGLETITSAQDLGYYLQADHLATKMLREFSHRPTPDTGVIIDQGRGSDPMLNSHLPRSRLN